MCENLTYALRRNFQSPVESKLQEGITVLDSGCGPGTWSFDMAEAFPNSTFYGIDASPVFPTEVKPRNYHFELANVSERLPYPDNYFDFVHQRLLVWGLTRAGWETAISELLRVLKPGGYLEISEVDCLFTSIGPKLGRLMDTLANIMCDKVMIVSAGKELGPNFLELKKDLEKLKRETYQFPVNHSGKLGEVYWNELREGYEAMHTWIIKQCTDLEDPEVYRRYLDDCAKECGEYKTCVPWFCYTAQKKIETTN